MKVLAGFALIVGVLSVATAAVAGIGVLLSILLPLSPFEAAVLFLGTTGVVIYALVRIDQTHQIRSMTPFFDDDEDDEGWGQRSVIIEAPQVGRNAPCPCGSGKKFKVCCGRRASR